jgi:uncharacterized protein (TIGR02996 family)
MTTLEALLQAICRDPGDDTAWLALADCLEEQGRTEQAELTRLHTALRHRPDTPGQADREARLQALLTAGVAPVMPALDGPAGLRLVLVPPGTFWMGSPPDEPSRDDDEGPRHRVTLTRGFWLGMYPVTQSQWRRVMGRNPSHGRGADHPVETVSWDDCQEFCARLNQHAAARAFRLPSEAEWEYACRACTTTAYCGGEERSTLPRFGWCSYDGEWDSSGGTRKVGELLSNAWGLFDMHGNVWEWVADWYGERYYAASPAVDPPGPDTGDEKVTRGGSWRGGPWFCRSAERRELGTDDRLINVGCRVARNL